MNARGRVLLQYTILSATSILKAEQADTIVSGVCSGMRPQKLKEIKGGIPIMIMIQHLVGVR